MVTIKLRSNMGYTLLEFSKYYCPIPIKVSHHEKDHWQLYHDNRKDESSEFAKRDVFSHGS